MAKIFTIGDARKAYMAHLKNCGTPWDREFSKPNPTWRDLGDDRFTFLSRGRKQRVTVEFDDRGNATVHLPPGTVGCDDDGLAGAVYGSDWEQMPAWN
jgi:hypothetical protein